MESSISQVAALVKRYLDGTIALHELEDTYLPLLWDADEDSDVVQFLGHVNNLIAERGRSDRTEESMREELVNAVRPFVLWVERPAPYIFLVKNRSMQAEQPSKTESCGITLRKPPAREELSACGTATSFHGLGAQA
jgi:hypothetical protein